MTSISTKMMKVAQLILSGAGGLVGWVDIGAHHRAPSSRRVNR
jgi:hypothetical protein